MCTAEWVYAPGARQGGPLIARLTATRRTASGARRCRASSARTMGPPGQRGCWRKPIDLDEHEQEVLWRARSAISSGALREGEYRTLAASLHERIVAKPPHAGSASKTARSASSPSTFTSRTSMAAGGVSTSWSANPPLGAQQAASIRARKRMYAERFALFPQRRRPRRGLPSGPISPSPSSSVRCRWPRRAGVAVAGSFRRNCSTPVYAAGLRTHATSKAKHRSRSTTGRQTPHRHFRRRHVPARHHARAPQRRFAARHLHHLGR